ncbi:MAG: purine/pyrimidine permease [Deltaproteobacteria bacterium]|nr:purine/pyrimidine permease [Deltaproteobacteria bacterium]
MQTRDPDRRSGIRYQPDETPPPALAFGLGLQLAVLCIAGIVLTPAIVIRAAGGSEGFLSWAVFAAVAVSGVTTILQAVRVGRFGAGHVLLMGTSGAFIAVCVAALVQGGPAMLATLVLVSSFFQFFLSSRLSLLRRILTPAVAGTVIMLIPVTVMPIVFGMLGDVPKGSPAFAAPLSALVTMAVMLCIALKATGGLRLWAPVIGVVVGSVVAAAFGLYNTGMIAGASWVGLPDGEWPGLDLGFGAVFWTLLPAFVFVTLVGAIETIGDAVAIQRVSWRGDRAVDFRAVQGAVGADGVGNLLSGLMATVPNTTYSTSIAVTELTGVASRRVGVAIGIIFVVLAFLPKALAVILAIPNPVVAAYATVLLSMLFVVGMKVVVQDELDYRTGLVVGVSFWAGVGFQNGVIFPEYFAEFAGGLLQNGMTAGGLVAILMTLFVELTAPRPSRVEVELGTEALPKIQEFLAGFASRGGWGKAMAGRLDAAAEETLLTLMRQDEEGEERLRRRMRLTARKEGGGAVLEFVAGAGNENIQDSIALLGTGPVEAPEEREISLRLLRHLASRVHHQQYHDTDIVTVRVDAPPADR